MAASSSLTRVLGAEYVKQVKQAAWSSGLSKCPVHDLVYGSRGGVVTPPSKRCTSLSVPALKRSRQSEAAAKLEEEGSLWEEAVEQAQQGSGGDARHRDLHQVVSPVPDAAPSGGAPQRALFIGGFALLVGAAAIALWSSQWLRLPWQKRRAPQGLDVGQSALSDGTVTSEAVENLPVSGADTMLSDGQEGPGSRPLQAAKVVQQQRQDDLAVSRDKVAAAEQASLAAQLLSDPLAEVASQQSPQEDTAASEKEQSPREDTAASKEEPLDSQLEEDSAGDAAAAVLPDLSRSAGPDEEAVFPKASDVNFVEQVDPPAEAEMSDSPSAEEDSGGDTPIAALPDLSRSAGPDEEAVFPKASDVNFMEQVDAPAEEPINSQVEEDSAEDAPAAVLPDLSRSAGPDEETVFPKASDVNFVEQVASPAEAGPSGSPSVEADSAEDTPAAALPDLSRSAGPDEEAVFPKASDVNFVEQVAPPADEGTSGSPSVDVSEDASVSSADAVDGPESSSAGLPGDVAARDAAELPQSVELIIEEEKVGELAPPTNGALSAPEVERQQQLLQKPKHIRRSQRELPQVPGQLRLVSGGYCAPSPEKAAAGRQGEDSWFASSALWGALGVADGVGSWMNEGVDPALYSRRLMETAEAAMKDGWGRLPNQGARGLMHLAQAATADVQGTSTVCVALMQPGCTLQAANLGDSGFRIFRDGECIFASEVQQHSFNCPYQAGSRLLHPNSDCANSADCYEIVLVEGDMIVMATDGIFDNLWDKELEKIVIKHTKDGARDEQAARRLAGKIVQAALARGKDEGARTPWVVEAAKHAPELLPWFKRVRPRGGKPDDCTAVVAFLNLDEY